jgi:hypothetical protein
VGPRAGLDGSDFKTTNRCKVRSTLASYLIPNNILTRLFLGTLLIGVWRSGRIAALILNPHTRWR